MDKRSRRRFTKEFKSETVALIRHSGKSIAEVCRGMGLAESSVHRWLAQAEIETRQRMSHVKCVNAFGSRDHRRRSSSGAGGMWASPQACPSPV